MCTLDLKCVQIVVWLQRVHWFENLNCLRLGSMLSFEWVLQVLACLFYWEDRINTDILDVLCRIRFFFIRTSVKNRLLSKQMHCHRHCRAGFRLPFFYGKRHFLNSDCLNDLYRTCSKFMDFMRDLNICSAYVPNGLDAFHSMVSGDFPQVLACIFARFN